MTTNLVVPDPGVLKKATLLSICKRRKWKRYSRLRKSDLARFVLEHDTMENAAATKIARAYRAHRQRWETAATVNDTDVFSGDPLPTKTFAVLSHGRRYDFVALTLLEYFLCAGKFENPYTREALCDWDLRRLQRSIVEDRKELPNFEINGRRYVLKNLVDVRHLITRARAEAHQRQELQEMFERNCLSTVREIVELVLLLNNQMHNVSEAICRILEQLIPQFMEYVQDLRFLSSHSAQNIFLQALSYLRSSGLVQSSVSGGSSSTGLRNEMFSSLIHIFHQQYESLFPQLSANL